MTTLILVVAALMLARKVYRHRRRDRELDRLEAEIARIGAQQAQMTSEGLGGEEVDRLFDTRIDVVAQRVAKVRQEWLADGMSLIERLKAFTSQQVEMAKTDRTFGILSALLPKRIAQEELGDALEDIRRREAEGRPPLEIRLKIVATIFWVSLHGLEHLAGRVGRVVSKLLGLVDLLKVFKR